MSINESLETCAKYQEYKIDGRVRGEERERDLKKSWPKRSHVLGNICWRSAFVLNRKQDKFKKNHRELKVKTISLKRKRKEVPMREEWCIVRDSRMWMLEWHLSALRLSTKSTKPDIYTLSNELLWKMEVNVQCLQIRQRCNNIQSIDLYYKIWQRNLLGIRENDVIRKHISQDRNIKLYRILQTLN